MPIKKVNNTTGFITFSLTPEERENLDLKARVKELESKVDFLMSVLRGSIDDNEV